VPILVIFVDVVVYGIIPHWIRAAAGDHNLALQVRRELTLVEKKARRVEGPLRRAFKGVIKCEKGTDGNSRSATSTFAT